MAEQILNIEDVSLIEYYGQNDSKINLVRKAFPDVVINSRGNQVKISGDPTQTKAVKEVLSQMLVMLKQYHELTNQSVIELLGGENPFEHKLTPVADNIIVYGRDGAPIKARTKNQKKMVELCEENDVVFAIGPAGSGKTYTAVALAVRALKAKIVKRIILTRPAVEAGESLGFLPGDLKEKVDPYLRPLYDALDDMIPHDKLELFIQNRTIEIAPLAFMRGRTLDNAFIILDEAQNTTDSQIKMFLTRFGPSAKCIVTGDMTQIDLPNHQRSGLLRATKLCENIQGIGMVYLNSDDVVRHRIVKEIVKAYDKDDEKIKKYKEEMKEQQRQGGSSPDNRDK